LQDALGQVIAEAYRKLDGAEEYFIGPKVSDDYLQSLGLPPRGRSQAVARRPGPPPIPDAPRAGVVVDRSLPVEDLEDDLGLGELKLDKDRPRLESASPVGRGRESAQRSASPSPRAPGGGPRPRPEHPKVLVVDDEDDIRKLLSRVLTQKGYQVIEASRGIEALELVREHVPDVILLDAMLPEVHGFDICRRIKGSKRYGHIPIVMVSAIYRGWRVAADLKSSYGVEAFLEKPFKIGDVLSHVENALEGRSEPNVEDDILSREASRFLDEGMEAYRNGDLDGAIAKLEEGLAIDPLSFQLHYHLGLLWGRRDNLFDAIHELETAVDLQPRHFAALKNLAILYQRAGFKHKAIEMWERALGNAPDDETRAGIKEHLMGLL
jgi:DNA-binding response OmpR family regulator